MKSNYMKSAELKIAKNPDMTEHDKELLMKQAKQKEIDLKVKIGLVQKVYISSDSYTGHRGLRFQFSYIDEWLYDEVMSAPLPRFETPQLTHESLDELIERVRDTTWRQPTLVFNREYMRERNPIWNDIMQVNVRE